MVAVLRYDDAAGGRAVVKLGLGQLVQVFAVHCGECKAEKVLEGPVTRHGAVHMLENHEWADGPRGWICPNCRTVNLNQRR